MFALGDRQRLMNCTASPRAAAVASCSDSDSVECGCTDQGGDTRGILPFANVSADGLTLYFSSSAETGLYLELFAATRAATELPFQTPQRIDELDDPEMHDGDPQISPNGLEMIFVRHAGRICKRRYRNSFQRAERDYETALRLGSDPLK